MYTVRIEQDTRVLDDISRAARRSPRTVDTFVNKTLRENVEDRAVKKLSEEPPPPDLPFIWSPNPRKNERARRWYFANMVPPGSAGGRYVRTGQLASGWVVTFREGVLTLEHPDPRVTYVQGERQVPSHAASGWNTGEDVALDESIYAQDTLIDFWGTILDAPGAFA